jgi:hypothetical protein
LLKAPLHVDPAFVMGVGVAACTCQDQPRRCVRENLRKAKKTMQQSLSLFDITTFRSTSEKKRLNHTIQTTFSNKERTYDSLQHRRHSNGRISCAFEWLKSGYKVHGSASHPTLQARYSVPYPSHPFAADCTSWNQTTHCLAHDTELSMCNTFKLFRNS